MIPPPAVSPRPIFGDRYAETSEFRPADFLNITPGQTENPYYIAGDIGWELKK